MEILVCVKRVPATGGRITLTPDGQEIDTRFLGFTISPHEECAVEEAVRIVEAQGGSSAVLTLGSSAAEEQLRDAMAIGIDRAILLETDGREFDPVATANAIVDTVRAQEAAGDAVRPDPVWQRGRGHRRLPGRDPGGRGLGPPDRDGDQGTRGA